MKILLNGLIIYIVLLCILLLNPKKTEAGGLFNPVIGTKTIGRLAVVADPDDTSTIFKNPAGILNVGSFKADISLSGLHRSRNYIRKNDDGTTEPEVSTLKPYGWMPFLGVVSNTGIKDLKVGFAAYTPYNATVRFPKNGSQRYQITDVFMVAAYFTPAVAYSINEYIQIGMGLSYIYAIADYKKALYIGELSDEDGWVSIEGKGNAFTFNAGAIINLSDSISLAFTYIHKAKLLFKGNLRLQVPESLQSFVPENSTNGSAAVNFPSVLITGFKLELTDKLTLTSDFYWIQHNSYKEFVVNLDKPLAGIEEFKQEVNASNCWSLGLGIKYYILKTLNFTSGIIWDTTPYPDEKYTLMNSDNDKLAAGLGFNYKFNNGFELSFALARIMYMERVIENNEIRPTFEIEGFVKYEADFTANGTEKAYSDLLSIQLSWEM